MDKEQLAHIDLIAQQNSVNALKYGEARQKFAEAKYELDVMVGAKYLKGEIDNKMAYEKALLFIACEDWQSREIYQKMLKYENIYKGLEKVIEANGDQIRWAQSKLKYTVEGEKYGS